MLLGILSLSNNCSRDPLSLGELENEPVGGPCRGSPATFTAPGREGRGGMSAHPIWTWCPGWFPLSQADRGNTNDLDQPAWLLLVKLCLWEAVGTDTTLWRGWVSHQFSTGPPPAAESHHQGSMQGPSGVAPMRRHILFPIIVTTKTISSKSTEGPCGLPQFNIPTIPMETCQCTGFLIHCGPSASRAFKNKY